MIRSTIKPFKGIGSFFICHKEIQLKNFQIIQTNDFRNFRYHSCLKIANLKYGYFTLVDKPIQSATLNSIIQLGAQFMYYPFIGWSWPAQASIFVGAIAYRILIQLLTKFIQVFFFNLSKNLNYQNFQNRFLYKIIQKAFLIDLNRDIKFYNIDEKKSSELFRYYKIGYLLKNGLTFYLNLNFLRAANYILINESFNSFYLHTMIFPTLAAHDPMFILPLIPMALTYLWVFGSRHPLLVHLNRHQNLFYRVNLAFMAGLIFVPLPTIYSLSYAGLLTGHLIIRKIYHQKSDIKQDWSNIFTAKSQKSQIYYKIKNHRKKNDQVDNKKQISRRN